MSPTRFPEFRDLTDLNHKRLRRRSASPSHGRRSRPSLEALETRQLLATFVVNNTGDNGGINPVPGAGTGTLRQAIIDADGTSAPADIVFRIPASTAPLLDFPVPGFNPGTQDWTITLQSPLPAITKTVSIDGYNEAPVGVPYVYPNAVSSTVQTVAVTGNPTAGTFTLTTAAPLPVGMTIPIPFDASAATVQAALGAIVGVNNITVSGGPGPQAAFTITFQNTDATLNIPDLGADGSLLTGGTTPGVFVETTTAGGTLIGEPTYIQAIPNSTAALQGNDAEQRVIIDGSHYAAASAGTGFVLAASDSTLRGLIITGFNVGVTVLAGTSGNPVVGDLIQGDSIGDYFVYPVNTITGSPLPSPETVYFTSNKGNAQQGVVLYSTNTTVGGSNPQENNIICGNGAQGILIEPGASGNQILGNQIGMAGPSTNGLYSQDGNGAEGVLIESTGSLSSPQSIDFASSNYIGSATGGNLISGNFSDGVHLVGVGANRNLIQGNYIGVAPGGGYKFGTGDPGNGNDGGNDGDGVLIEDGSENQIGGASASLANTIDSNHGDGIDITGLATDNVAAHNMIGVTAGGDQVLGNWSDGVALYSPSNTIGPGNVISQNLLGIGIYGPAASTPGNASDTLVVDNLIGTDGTGQQGFGNAYEGIRIDNSADNTIQGNAAGSQTISGNQVGVALIGVSSAGNLLEGNLIGTDNTGKSDLGNKNEGVLIEGAYNNTIGGTTSAALNVISANHWGVRLDGASATDNLVEGNYIGTDITGKLSLGNEINGVIVSNDASENTIGGTVAGAGNTIAFNVFAGVSVESGTGDSILSNSIFSNNQLGIVLVTPSTPPGPNDLQTAPVLTSAVGGGSENEIQGTLASIANTPFLIQFFSSPVPDPSGYGQGQTPIGSTTVTTDGQGNAAIAFNPSSSLASDAWVTATATNTLTGDTSEFSNALSAQPITMQFETATLSVDVSAGYAIMQVDRVGNPDATVSVNYATSNGTATAGQDYTSASGTLTFQPGETEETFSVTVLPNPSQVASSVTVNLALSQPTGGSTLGSPSTAVLTINNNVPPMLQFSTSTYSTYSGSNSAIVSVARGGGSLASTVQVQYATAGGTAVPGVAYTAVSGTLTFLANQTTATFTVPILPGGAATVAKTVGLVLSNPSAPALLGPISNATLTIQAGSNPYNPVGPTNSIPPQVTGEQLVLGSAGITAVLFSFSEPLTASRVPDLGNYGYYVDVAGPNGVFGTSSDIYIPLSSAQYSSATSTIAVFPAAPLPLNRFERIILNGLANPLLGRGLTNTSGVLLSGLSNGVPGSPFVATFGVGSSLAYTDSTGKVVNLSLTSGGLIEMYRTPTGNAQSVILIGTVPGKSVLTFQASNAGARTTYMPPIQNAAGVRFRYKTPASVFRSTPQPVVHNARVKPAVSKRRK